MIADHFVGWIQNYLSPAMCGGRNKQALLAGKIISVTIVLSSVSIALYGNIAWLQMLQLGMVVVWAFLVPAYLGLIFDWIHSPTCILTAIISIIVAIRYELYMYGFLADTCAHGGTWCTGCQAQCGPDFKGYDGGPMFGFIMSADKMPAHHNMWTDCIACHETPGYDPDAPWVASVWDANTSSTIVGNHPAARPGYPGVVAPPMLNSTCYCGVWVIGLMLFFSAVIKIVEMATGVKYDDQNKPSWMMWDRINPTMYTHGVLTDTLGQRMLIKGDKPDEYLTAQVTTVKAVGETTVVCKIIDHNNTMVKGKVLETGRVVQISELAGFPFSMAVKDDIYRALRPYYDTPLGTIIFFAVPGLFFWVVPIWETSWLDCDVALGNIFGKPEYGWCGDSGNWTLENDGEPIYEEIAGFGLPAWAYRFMWACFWMSTLQAFSWLVLSRMSDADGVAIAGTSADIWAKVWPLDLTWGEIFKYGCRNRVDWVLDEISKDQLEDWSNAHPDFDFSEFKGKSGAEINANMTALGHTGSTFFPVSPEQKATIREAAIAIYYMAGTYLPPPGTKPASAPRGFVSGLTSASGRTRVIEIKPASPKRDEARAMLDASDSVVPGP